MKLISVIAAFGFLGVLFGAFGAHAIADTVTPARLAAYKTGVLYHLLHTLAAFAVASLSLQQANWPQLRRVAVLFLAGIFIFSGSLYCLVIFDVSWLGAITPIGGVLLLCAWVMLAVSAWRKQND